MGTGIERRSPFRRPRRRSVSSSSQGVVGVPWWRSPWPSAVAVVVPAVLLLWGVSVPGGYFPVLVAALVCWSLVALAWSVAAVTCVARRVPRRQWLPLLVVPVAFAAGWTVASGDLVGRATFAGHREQLLRRAELQGQQPSFGYERVGLYAFEAVYRQDGCVFFSVDDPAMAKESGFAWCADVVPDRSGERDFAPFDGAWYVYVTRYESWANRYRGARPWGVQLTEIRPRPSV